MTDAEKRALAQSHRAALRDVHVRCEPTCRHGWPDIWHESDCVWNNLIEAIYTLERELGI